jgi:hypothetical protein
VDKIYQPYWLIADVQGQAHGCLPLRFIIVLNRITRFVVLAQINSYLFFFL